MILLKGSLHNAIWHLHKLYMTNIHKHLQYKKTNIYNIQNFRIWVIINLTKEKPN